MLAFRPPVSNAATASLIEGLPLLPVHARKVMLVGETASFAHPRAALLDEVLHEARGGCFGLLLRTSQDQVISWSPLIRIEDTSSSHIQVRCIGRVLLSQLWTEPLEGTSLRIDRALAEPYNDAPLSCKAAKELDVSLVETEQLLDQFRERHSRANTLRGMTAEDVIESENMTLSACAEERARALPNELLVGVDSPERQLATFAAMNREIVTWKSRLAAMQCTDSAARVALAQRAMRWTVNRLDAEISIRTVFPRPPRHRTSV